MGRLLIALASRDPAHKIVGALEAHGNSAIGADAGELAGVGKLGVKVTDDYASLARPDTVTLDFTTADRLDGTSRSRVESGRRDRNRLDRLHARDGNARARTGSARRAPLSRPT